MTRIQTSKKRVRRNFKRAKKSVKPSKGLTQAVKTVLRGQIESKHIDTELSANMGHRLIYGTNLAGLIVKGVGTDQMVGRIIDLTKLRIRGVLETHSDQDTSVEVEFLVVKKKGGLPLDNIYSSAAWETYTESGLIGDQDTFTTGQTGVEGQMAYFEPGQKEYSILWRKKFILPPGNVPTISVTGASVNGSGTTTTTQTTVGRLVHKRYELTVFLKNRRYDMDNPDGDQYHLLVRALGKRNSTQGLQNQASITQNTRLYYKDI